MLHVSRRQGCPPAVSVSKPPWTWRFPSKVRQSRTEGRTPPETTRDRPSSRMPKRQLLFRPVQVRKTRHFHPGNGQVSGTTSNHGSQRRSWDDGDTWQKASKDSIEQSRAAHL